MNRNVGRPAGGAEPTSPLFADYTVSELSIAIRNSLRKGFPKVRVTGEISKVSASARGYVFFDLIERNSVLRAVYWGGGRRGPSWQSFNVDEGMLVKVVGSITSYAGRSSYQLNATAVEQVGAGQLLAELEERKARLRDEGLFDLQQESALPFIPGVIGVITAPTGAVIHDIITTVARRFPRPIVVWPVKVQGERCSREVAAALRGFNELPRAPAGGLDPVLAQVPRPDVIIVARGGGAFEHLLGFSSEDVVRAAAASAIPVISAIGHETDTTLVDLAANKRAATPTAAAERAVPDRSELERAVNSLMADVNGSWQNLIVGKEQSLHDVAERLRLLGGDLRGHRQRLAVLTERLHLAQANLMGRRRLEFSGMAVRHAHPAALQQAKARLSLASGRISLASIQRAAVQRADALHRSRSAFDSASTRIVAARRQQFDALARIHDTLNYRKTLNRGFAIVRDGDRVVGTKKRALNAPRLEIEFQDGRLDVRT
ncbi:MAG: exodeoxyribonuclease VII large subunit [Rhodobacteraceae bacterium]|nr:exodeoxyribonuclease VII large subunit [Paracoccaceae bacterium]